MNAAFKVEQVTLGADGLTVILHGQVMQGNITSGMLIELPIHNSFSISFEIAEVVSIDSSALHLVIQAEDTKEAEFIVSFNPVGEIFMVA
jgi:hypothetical protein